MGNGALLLDYTLAGYKIHFALMSVNMRTIYFINFFLEATLSDFYLTVALQQQFSVGKSRLLGTELSLMMA